MGGSLTAPSNPLYKLRSPALLAGIISKDLTAPEANNPIFLQVAGAGGHHRISLNIRWALLTGFPVRFKPGGFVRLEAGNRAG